MAASVRFLQCAGFRFDSPFWDGPEKWVTLRNQDLWQTFQAVLSLCHSEKIEFLFIAGNLFEQEYVRKETVERVAASLAELEGTRIFITPGKRDPLIISSAYRLTVWPSNVHIFPSGVTSVKVPSHNLTVYGAGWTAYHQERSFLDNFKPIKDGTLRFMLLHALVDTKPNVDGVMPILPDQIAASGLDYLALGYQEAWSGIQKTGNTAWADCGSPEARSFQDKNPHGVLLGELGKETSRFELRELGQRCYIEKDLSIQSTDTVEGIAERLLAETRPEERQKNLFRINLSGALFDVEELIQPLENFLQTQFKYLEVLPLKEGTHAQLETKLHSRQKIREGFPTFAQIFINKLEARRVENAVSKNSEYWDIVQKIGLSALGQGRIADED